MLYRHNNGALVFGAGTTQWSWGLTRPMTRWNADRRTNEAGNGKPFRGYGRPTSVFTSRSDAFYGNLFIAHQSRWSRDNDRWAFLGGQYSTTSNFTTNGIASPPPPSSSVHRWMPTTQACYAHFAINKICNLILPTYPVVTMMFMCGSLKMGRIFERHFIRKWTRYGRQL